MSNLTQVFVAPGKENLSLNIPPSPWHYERWVNIPSRYWEVIIDYSKSIDLELSEKLNMSSFSNKNDGEFDYVYICPEELNFLLDFIEKIMLSIEKSKKLIHSKSTDEMPDVYENIEYIRMLEAVSAVFRESVNQRLPYRAWIE